ncbi:MAG: OmpA family protein [Endomicrobiaceae bacterium]|nr:OmpA family protein [Endomicrobiaceae bacterium]
MNIVKSFIFAVTGLFLCLAVVNAQEQIIIPAVVDIPSTTVNDSFNSIKTGTYKGNDFIKISLKNKIFSPNNTENLPTELIFEINVLDENIKVKKWRMDLINTRKENVYTAYGNTIPPVIKWNGVKDGEIAEGKYKYIFTVEIWKKDKVVVEDGNIVVDVTPPLALLKSSTDVAVVADNKFLEDVIFSLSASDETGVNLNKTNLKILNAKNNMEIKSWNLQTASQQNIIWDGKDDVYERLVPAGEYKLILNTSDIAGNKSRLTRNISVIEFNIEGNVADIVVKEKLKGLPVDLYNSVIFKSSDATLTGTAVKSLELLTKLLNKYPANKVLIEGYTDAFECKQTKNDLELSSKRARAVYDFFILNGVDPKRLQTVGYGKAKPIASNKDIRTRILNRRVDIIILKIESDFDEINKNN